MYYSPRFMLFAMLSIMMIACTTPPKTESTGEFIDSSTTTAKVKASLVDQLGTSGLVVKVKTWKDQVQLSGFVDTQGIKNRAAGIAAGVDGVRSVQNDLIVKSR